MGLDPKCLPDYLLRRMPKTDRAAMGKAGITLAEATVKSAVKHEKELQSQCAQLNNQRNLFYSVARMDRKTTTRKGLFDMAVFLPSGRYLAVEFKITGGVVSVDQQKVFSEFWQKTGQVVHIILNLQQYKELLDAHTA